jgi:hypothetical protein
MTMSQGEKLVEEFLDRQAEGPRWKLRRELDEDGLVSYWAAIEDEELDLYRVDFYDGCAEIQTEGYSHILLSPAQLHKLARLAEQAEERMETWRHSRAGRKWLDQNR